MGTGFTFVDNYLALREEVRGSNATKTDIMARTDRVYYIIVTWTHTSVSVPLAAVSTTGNVFFSCLSFPAGELRSMVSCAVEISKASSSNRWRNLNLKENTPCVLGESF